MAENPMANRPTSPPPPPPHCDMDREAKRQLIPYPPPQVISAPPVKLGRRKHKRNPLTTFQHVAIVALFIAMFSMICYLFVNQQTMNQRLVSLEMIVSQLTNRKADHVGMATSRKGQQVDDEMDDDVDDHELDAMDDLLETVNQRRSKRSVPQADKDQLKPKKQNRRKRHCKCKGLKRQFRELKNQFVNVNQSVATEHRKVEALYHKLHKLGDHATTHGVLQKQEMSIMGKVTAVHFDLDPNLIIENLKPEQTARWNSDSLPSQERRDMSFSDVIEPGDKLTRFGYKMASKPPYENATDVDSTYQFWKMANWSVMTTDLAVLRKKPLHKHVGPEHVGPITKVCALKPMVYYLYAQIVYAAVDYPRVSAEAVIRSINNDTKRIIKCINSVPVLPPTRRQAAIDRVMYVTCTIGTLIQMDAEDCISLRDANTFGSYVYMNTRPPASDPHTDPVPDTSFWGLYQVSPLD